SAATSSSTTSGTGSGSGTRGGRRRGEPRARPSDREADVPDDRLDVGSVRDGPDLVHGHGRRPLPHDAQGEPQGAPHQGHGARPRRARRARRPVVRGAGGVGGRSARSRAGGAGGIPSEVPPRGPALHGPLDPEAAREQSLGTDPDQPRPALARRAAPYSRSHTFIRAASGSRGGLTVNDTNSRGGSHPKS